MPKSCLYVLTKIIRAAQTFSIRPVARLEMIDALLQEIESKSLQISKDSLLRYRQRLRNWQLADSVIFQVVDARATWKGKNIFEDPPPYRLKGPYERYCELALENGLTPMKYSTFKYRAWDYLLEYKAKHKKTQRRG
jgi:hypothetical protein